MIQISTKWKIFLLLVYSILYFAKYFFSFSNKKSRPGIQGGKNQKNLI